LFTLERSKAEHSKDGNKASAVKARSHLSIAEQSLTISSFYCMLSEAYQRFVQRGGNTCSYIYNLCCAQLRYAQVL